jgi:hypothetical protein
MTCPPRWIERAGGLAAQAAAAVAWAAIALWLAGLLLGDRWPWSQWVAYIPRPALVFAAAAALGARALLARAAMRPPGGRARRLAPGACVGVMLLHLALLDWRLYRALAPDPPASTQAIRLLAWNPSWERVSAFDERVLEHRPEIAVITLPHYSADMVALRRGMAEHTYAVRSPTFVVLSVFPVVRWGYTHLGVRAEQDRPGVLPPGLVSVSGGEAAWVELDTRERLGHTTVIWCVDLPSDPFLPRRRAMREAMAAMQRYVGPVQTRTADGLDHYDPLEPGARVDGFPTPDIVAGDFNTPRGAGALSLLPHGLENAYTQAGWGPSGTYPRWLPVLHIDHVFVGPRLRARSYGVADLGAGRHAAVVVEVGGKSDTATQ